MTSPAESKLERKIAPLLTTIVTKEHFIRVTSTKCSLVDKQIDRSIRPESVQVYLNSLKSPLSREFAEEWIKTVQYISFFELYGSLLYSLRAALKEIGDKSWCILLNDRKYASEHWLIQLLFLDELKGKEPTIYYEIVPGIPSHIVVIDDASYSGGNVFGLLDESAYQKDKRCTDENKHDLKEYTVHIVIPFISEVARDTIVSVKNYHGYREIKLYPHGKYISTLPLTEKYFYLNRGEWMIRKELVEDCDLEEVSALVPIYFDHKIASGRSTASGILQRLVNPPPTRAPILRAAAAWESIAF